ncbi:MAG: homoprotocatechuate degradation operon regulator HpaR [Pseudomonadota bacterium]
MLPPTSRSLPFALLRAREAVMAPIRDMLSTSGITEQQWRVLRVLAEFGPLDATTLAERASLLVPSLTRIAQSMNARGLITHDRDANDRRRLTISIAPAGEAILDANTERAAAIAWSLRQKLGDADHERLLDLLIALDTRTLSPLEAKSDGHENRGAL